LLQPFLWISLAKKITKYFFTPLTMKLFIIVLITMLAASTLARPQGLRLGVDDRRQERVEDQGVTEIQIAQERKAKENRIVGGEDAPAGVYPFYIGMWGLSNCKRYADDRGPRELTDFTSCALGNAHTSRFSLLYVSYDPISAPL
jgi:hypothetical protein